MARYEAGETLASIARTYDCSPPAISYVVSRSRARVPGQDAAKPPSPPEPQLIKSAASDTNPSGIENAQEAADKPVPNGHAAPPPNGSSGSNGSMPPNGDARSAELDRPAASFSDRPPLDPPRGANGPAHNGANGHPHEPSAAAGAPSSPPPHTNGTDQRRTLHLSLGGAGPGNGSGQPAEPLPGARMSPPQRAQAPQPGPSAPYPGAPYRNRDGGPARFSDIRPVFDEPARRGDAEAPPRKDGGGSFIDRELRARVDSDIAAFLAAFDAALEEDTQESRFALREATDRLLRAGARTRIELERLEARVPLPPRDANGGGEPAWRHR